MLLKVVEYLHGLSCLNRLPRGYTDSNRLRTVNHIRRGFQIFLKALLEMAHIPDNRLPMSVNACVYFRRTDHFKGFSGGHFIKHQLDVSLFVVRKVPNDRPFTSENGDLLHRHRRMDDIVKPHRSGNLSALKLQVEKKNCSLWGYSGVSKPLRPVGRAPHLHHRGDSAIGQQDAQYRRTSNLAVHGVATA